MREWQLKSGDPLSLTLAADARLGPTDYSNDQIWELTLGGGEPPALALETTYGLRARSLRLFPRFIEGDLILTDPEAFYSPPRICKFYPNYLLLNFSPLPYIDVEAEYWVPQSQVVTGRITLSNHDENTRQIQIEWVAQLTPIEGHRMTPIEIDAAPALSGHTADLAPVVFLTNGPKPGSGPYPSLKLEIELPPDESYQLRWSHAARSSTESSFALARYSAARNWDTETARVELLNAGLIDIHTGDTDWDAAFAFTQKLAHGLFTGPTSALPSPSFVLTRQPDQGYSQRGDGSEYNHLWSGQTPLEAYYLSGMILPNAPDLAKGLLHNFLITQTEEGMVDWKPGLAGQRSRLMATPILASIAWRIYQSTDDITFLEQSFPQLLKFVHAWFTPQHDRDGDGIPEWDHPMQTGLEDHPIFSGWHRWGQGVEINTAESPALCALLYRECQTLIQIATLLNRSEPIMALESYADNLRTALETAWNEITGSYHYWDRDTHFTTRGELIAERTGAGRIDIQRAFEEPIRLLVRVHPKGETTRTPHIIVHGTSASGHRRVEHIKAEKFKWYLGVACWTGDRVYSNIEEVEIHGLEMQDQVSIYSVDYCYQDHTVMLPMWAGIPDANRAETMVRETITNSDVFWQPFGIPAFPKPPEDSDASICYSTHLVWNTLYGEGLVEYGYHTEAAELVTRLMAGIIKTLKQEKAFRRYYRSDTGSGVGDRNALSGLAPLGLFLDVLGIRLMSPKKVALKGFNPFPWPVTVKYRGMTILRQKQKTSVIFPDGQTIEVNDPSPLIVSLEVEPDSLSSG